MNAHVTRRNEQERLTALRTLGVMNGASDPAIDAVARAAADLCDTPIALVTLLDSDRQLFKSAHGVGDMRETPRAVSFCTHAIADPDRVMVVPDATADARFAANPLVTGEPQIRSYAGAPIVTDEGFALGTLCVADRRPRELSKEQISQLQSLAVAVSQLLAARHTKEQVTELGLVIDQSRAEVYTFESASAPIAYMSRGMRKKLGLRDRGDICRSVLDINDGVDRQELNTVLESLKTGEHTFSTLTTTVKHAGVEYPAETRFQFVPSLNPPVFVGFVTDLSERVQAARAVAEVETRYRDLFNNAHDCIQSVALEDGSFEFVNPAWLRTLGYTAEEVESFTLLDIVHPDEQDHCNSLLDRVLQGEDINPVATAFIAKCGRKVFVEGTVTCRSVSGKPVSMCCIFRDVTEEHLTRAALYDSEERIRLLADGLPVLIEYVDKDECYRFANRTFETWYGCSSASVEGRSVESVVGEVAYVTIAKWLRQALKGEQVAVDFERPDPNGTMRYVHAVYVPHLSPEGDVVGAYVLALDITERKALEVALHQRSSAVEAATDGIVITDPECRIEYASPALLQMTGYSLEELKGNTCALFQGADTSADILADMRECIRNGRPFYGEVLNYKKSGESFWNLLRIEVLRNECGEISNFVGVQTDITERKVAEYALFEAKEQAQVTLASIGDAVITTDRWGRLSYMNPVAEELTGWKENDARGCGIESVFGLMDEATELPLKNPVRACLSGVSSSDERVDAVLIDVNGHERFVRETVSPIRDDGGDISGAVLVFSDITHERRMRQEIVRQATYDVMTGLVNRREFERRLERALEGGKLNDSRHALCYLDLDQFKVVNDTCGHVAGDALLGQLAVVLSSNLRSRDTLARLGGDEFGLLLENCALEDARKIADDLRERVAAFEFVWHGRRFKVGVSVGLVGIDAQSQSAAAVLSAADGACYAAKDSGRNRVYVHDSDDGGLAKRHLEMTWVERIHHALAEEQFHLYAQPQVPICANAKEGLRYELLLRLTDEQGVMSLPGAFMPAAERYDLCHLIDRWVIQYAVAWLDANPLALQATEVCSVNVSGKSLNDDTLLDFVTGVLDEHAVPAHKICFEITETAAIEDLGRARAFISALRSRGCGFALDDFGSGMASFSYLKSLPVDYLKIDGPFIQQMMSSPIDQAMVRMINDLGHLIHARTVAEFVENQDVLGVLRDMGVDYVQGFGVADPRPWEQMFLPGQCQSEPVSQRHSSRVSS